MPKLHLLHPSLRVRYRVRATNISSSEGVRGGFVRMYLQLFLTTDPLHYNKLHSTSVHVFSKWTLAICVCGVRSCLYMRPFGSTFRPLGLICFPFFTFHAANSLSSCQQRIRNHLQRLETCLTLQWTPCILLL